MQPMIDRQFPGRASRNRRLRHLGLFAALAGLAWLAPLALAAAAVTPSKDALSLIELVRARRMGTDAAGHLWAWDPQAGTMRFFSPAAERLDTLVVPPGGVALDGDLRWGAVALIDEGATLVWVRPGAGSQEEGAGAAAGAPPPAGPAASPAGPAASAGTAGGSEIKLPEPAGWVCWIDQDTVAVSPQRAGHRVEIWDLRDRQRRRSFGKEMPITLKNGATRVREVQLRYDPSRRLLYTLESFTGDLQVFQLDGKLDGRAVWHVPIANPWKKLEEAKLADLDARARSNDVAYPQAFSDLWLMVGPDGSAWVRQDVDVLKQSVTLMRASAAGTAVKTVEKVRCPARYFTIWGDRLIFYQDVQLPREVCNSVAPLP
jgi:hypothetical protein